MGVVKWFKYPIIGWCRLFCSRGSHLTHWLAPSPAKNKTVLALKKCWITSPCFRIVPENTRRVRRYRTVGGYTVEYYTKFYRRREKRKTRENVREDGRYRARGGGRVVPLEWRASEEFWDVFRRKEDNFDAGPWGQRCQRYLSPSPPTPPPP